MKNISIKLRITLWFAAFLAALCAAMLAVIGLVSQNTAGQETRARLAAFVSENASEAEYDDGELDVDDDYLEFQNGMYCLIFYPDGTLARGYAPYQTLLEQPFADQSLRTVEADGESFLVYDRLIDDGRLWLRGLTAADSGAVSRGAVYSAALVALPLLVLLAVVGGYLVARRALRPLRQINSTAEAIAGSGDLSRRIDIGPGRDELHQTAAAFNHMLSRLEQNFEAERRFTSDASHELRTPVSVILAQCEYAFENASGEAELYEALGAIQKQGYRMSRLIDALLQFTRMEQHTERIEMQPLDLSELTATVCREQQEAGTKNIALSCQLQPGLTLNGNAALLSRLLENLISNAYKYGKQDGHIWVRLFREGRQIVLQVRDDGVGIEPEELPRIWARFYRVDKARSAARQPGLGLGLAMVRQIAQLHGGEAQAESTPGQGSVFTVRFEEQAEQA